MCLEIEYNFPPRHIYTYIITNKNRIVMSVAFIIGWVALVASWVVPNFIKNGEMRRFIGGILASFATGIFTGELILNLIK